jgi:hypothetical protein
VSFTFCHSRESGNPGKRLKKEVSYLLEKLLRHKKYYSYLLEMALVTWPLQGRCCEMVARRKMQTLG